MTQAMAEMLPPFVPARVPLVYLTGLLEIGLALGLALPATRRLAGFAAIAILVLFFPANVYAAFAQVEMGGHAWDPSILIRAPLPACSSPGRPGGSAQVRAAPSVRAGDALHGVSLAHG